MKPVHECLNLHSSHQMATVVATKRLDPTEAYGLCVYLYKHFPAEFMSSFTSFGSY